jgi:hypothetical protein
LCFFLGLGTIYLLLINNKNRKKMKKSNMTWQKAKHLLVVASFSAAAFFLVLGASPTSAQTSDPEQSGSVGLSGTISSPPPEVGATISNPTNGQSFTEVPVPVRGACPTGLLVKLFKNNVFAGSVQCENGSYELNIDLFTGENELIARVYDDLDQPGPDSNIVTVNFVDNRAGAGSRVSVTSNFAKRGANPGQTLTWPITISGGSGPYAFSVDWGDGSSPDLFSEEFPGNLTISHIYDQAGIYNIVIRVSDSNGSVAFLQLVGVANGPLSQVGPDGQPLSEAGQDDGITFFASGSNTVLIWWPATLTIPFVITTFWLGKKHMVRVMKKRIEHGEHPFADI